MFPVLQKGFAAVLLAAICATGCGGTSSAATLPAPAVDAPKASDKHSATAVFAGGCFWGVDAVFKHVKGVSTVVSGYAGGSEKTAHYELVGSGLTGHAESVQVTYDPTQISYGQLLRVFFSVAHDPTQLNRQGPDVGSQYRSAIFYLTDEQKTAADAYIAQLTASHAYPGKIVTEVAKLNKFYRAEDYHQNYAELHPNDRYIAINDAPKVANLKKSLPQFFTDKLAAHE